MSGDVLTRALLRFVDLPRGTGRMALITLDNGSDRPSTLAPETLASLSAALDEAERSEAVAVGITGKRWMFSAGAELTAIGSVHTPDDAREIGRRGHRVLRRLGEMAIPSFAFVNGIALGGALEVALHCTYRTVSATAAPIGLPEVGLGLIPGWGGAWLLPNLVGIEPAVQVILEAPLSGGRMLDGPAARASGIADAIFPAEGFLERSIAWAADVLRGDVRVERPPVDRDTARWDAVLRAARQAIDARLRGAAPAPYRALDLLAAARTASRDEGFAAEDEALAELLVSPETRASLYAFHLTRSRAKRPSGAPDRSLARPVTSVGVVGAGLMASQLALLFARRLDVPVVMTDLDEERVQRGLGWVRSEVEKLVQRGRMSERAARRLNVTGSVDKAVLADCDLVIEAVFEDLDAKQAVFREIDGIVRDDCVLATNTSSLSVSAMGSVLRRPERLVGMHFFNPVSRMPLLEIIRTERTDDVALATAYVVGEKLRKTVVFCADARGFVVNRLLSRIFVEVMHAVDDGTPILVADAALDPLGLPMSPFELLALVGPAVQLHVNEILQREWPERYPVSDNLRRIVEHGLPGVYRREHQPGADRQLLPGVAELLQVKDSPWHPADVLQAVRDGLADEARRILDEGVVAGSEDIDLAMLLGAGWPGHLGGLTPYLERTGGF